jgi:hypothetical protein
MGKLAALFNIQPFQYTLGSGIVIELHPLTLGQLIVLQYDELVAALNEGKKIEDLPDFTAKAISLSISNNFDELETIKLLPAGLQTNLFSKVWEISQIQDDVLGKFLEMIATAIMKVAMNNPHGTTVLQSLSKNSLPPDTD